jgi:magnesium-protoporphyrin O-methyltransferase
MRERGAADFTHLDIGGGVGVLQHELARDGAVQTTAVDASRPYLELLRRAAAERGYEARQRRIEGDFTQVADSVEPATVVTLDKVICCYPDMVTLVRASARKATALYGIVVPRDTAWVRASVGLINWILRRVLHWQFRAFAHSHRAIDRLCAEEGLSLHWDDPGLLWCVRLYRRAAA